MNKSQTSADILPGSIQTTSASSRKFILIAAILASSLGFIDGSIVSIALPSIRASLGGTLAQAQWISNGYLLPLSALILVGGAIGDRYGLARVFASGIALFILASIACSFAPSAEFLIFARALQGFGAAFMIPGSLALISRVYPPGERGKAIGIWAAASAVTSALGPIIGGLLLTFGSDDSWRLIFAINLPLGAIALFLLYRHIDNDPTELDRGIDLAGAVFAILSLGLLAGALTGVEQGNIFGYSPWLLGVLSLLCSLIFILIELRSPHPMMPLALFTNTGFSAANVVSFLIYFSFSAILFYLPMAMIGGWGESEINTATAYAPLSIFIALLSGSAGKTADKYGPGYLLVAGSLVLAAGYAALALAFPTQNFWDRILPAMVCQGIGMGLVVAPVSTAIMGTVEANRTGIASGINNAVTRMAGLIAIAAMGIVVATAYTSAGGTESFGTMGNTAQHAVASNAAFVRVAYVASAFCVIAAIISWIYVPRVPLKKRRKQY
jgi:EmrB/QacA subfamily drug resistance transporter